MCVSDRPRQVPKRRHGRSAGWCFPDAPRSTSSPRAPGGGRTARGGGCPGRSSSGDWPAPLSYSDPAPPAPRPPTTHFLRIRGACEAPRPHRHRAQQGMAVTPWVTGAPPGASHLPVAPAPAPLSPSVQPSRCWPAPATSGTHRHPSRRLTRPRTPRPASARRAARASLVLVLLHRAVLAATAAPEAPQRCRRASSSSSAMLAVLHRTPAGACPGGAPITRASGAPAAPRSALGMRLSGRPWRSVASHTVVR